MKTCIKCGVLKPVAEFHRHPKTKDGTRATCKPCSIEYQKEYVKANKDVVAERMKAYRDANRDKVLAQQLAYKEKNKTRIAERRREKERGFSAELYAQVLEAQGHLCAICAADLRQVRPSLRHADHCHKTGAARGVLCVTCNTGLGKFKDDPEVLRRAIAYLENPIAGIIKCLHN